MQNMNKKGLSNVIGMVLIIILGITLVGVLSTGIFNLVKDPSLAPEQSCLVLNTKNVLQIEQTCYNEITKDLEITVRRSNDETFFLNSLKFTSGSETWECGNSCGTCKLLQPGNSRKYFFAVEGAKSVSISGNNCILDQEKISNCN